MAIRPHFASHDHPVLRVLVVEDDRDTAQLTGQLLRRDGHHVTIALDGMRALEAARQQPPDVVLLDIHLPDIDGYEVGQRLREGADGKRPLLVAVTGCDGEEHRRRSAEAGIDLHLVKPVDFRQLQHLLHRFHGVVTQPAAVD